MGPRNSLEGDLSGRQPWLPGACVTFASGLNPCAACHRRSLRFELPSYEFQGFQRS